MQFLQAVLSSFFMILGAGSMFFIADKALVIGNDVTEMKDVLREMQRGSRGITPAGNAFPAPLDTYDPPTPMKPEKEFVMPPPISRRLDAERGIKREDAAELEFGFKSSEPRH